MVPDLDSGQSDSYSKEEYYEQARVVLGGNQCCEIPRTRRRALSVGLQSSSTCIWVDSGGDLTVMRLKN